MASVKCPKCGTELTADDKGQLMKDLQAHARAHHDTEMPESQAREMVEEGNA
jgi:predicted small metal-binding protein